MDAEPLILMMVSTTATSLDFVPFAGAANTGQNISVKKWPKFVSTSYMDVLESGHFSTEQLRGSNTF